MRDVRGRYERERRNFFVASLLRSTTTCAAGRGREPRGSPRVRAARLSAGSRTRGRCRCSGEHRVLAAAHRDMRPPRATVGHDVLTLEGLAVAIPSGFESPLPHHILTRALASRALVAYVSSWERQGTSGRRRAGRCPLQSTHEERTLRPGHRARRVGRPHVHAATAPRARPEVNGRRRLPRQSL